MRRFSLFLLALAAICACSQLSPEEQAAQVAKSCYDQLLAGRYEAFLEGRAGMDSIPDGYREQLLTAYKQFMSQQREAHGGISSVQVNRTAFMEAPPDTTFQWVQVFMNLNYADSTSEEIVVLMVDQTGEWKMR